MNLLQQIINKRYQGAIQIFLNHSMEEIGPGHWRLRNKDSSSFWCDVVVVGPGLAVWGDIDGCFFSYHKTKYPEQMVHWMADGPTDYALEKASIGMGDIGIVDYDHQLLIGELEEEIKIIEADYNGDWSIAKKAFDRAIFDLKVDLSGCSCAANVENVLRDFCDEISSVCDSAYEWVFDLGKIPSMRVIYALAAINKLSQLLLLVSK